MVPLVMYRSPVSPKQTNGRPSQGQMKLFSTPGFHGAHRSLMTVLYTALKSNATRSFKLVGKANGVMQNFVDGEAFRGFDGVPPNRPLLSPKPRLRS